MQARPGPGDHANILEKQLPARRGWSPEAHRERGSLADIAKFLGDVWARRRFRGF